jgi:hypothetical protein
MYAETSHAHRGREVIEWLNEAIERYHAKIRHNRDEIDGKVSASIASGSSRSFGITFCRRKPI